jgi:VanZ like family
LTREARPVSGSGSVVANAWLDRMVAFWSPGWTILGCFVAALVAIVARRTLARSARMPMWASVLYLVGLGMAVALTVSPRSPHDSYFAFVASPRRCTLAAPSAFGLDTLTSSAWQFNLVMFLPAGAACRLAARSSDRWRLLAITGLVPVGIEAVQFAAASLYRTCEGLDVATNWLSIAIGYAGAALILRVHRWASRWGDGAVTDTLRE